MSRPTFWNYLLTNTARTVLYTGMTNNLERRLIEHFIGKEGSFTTRYVVHHLVWYDSTPYVLNAIATEKELKDWKRIQKEELITAFNPKWRFLNEEILGHWPPSIEEIEEVKAALFLK